MEVLVYPIEIFPRREYLTRIDISQVVAVQEAYVIRRSKYDFEGTFIDLGGEVVLRELALDKSSIPNMSMNLLGGEFKPFHSVFAPTMKSIGVEPWDGLTICSFEATEGNFSVHENCVPIFFLCNAIHESEVPYSRKKEKEFAKVLKVRNLTPELVEEYFKLLAKVKVIHAPTNFNYWHVEFVVQDHIGKVVKDGDSAWKSDLLEQVKTDCLLVNALASLENVLIGDLPKDIYVKKTA